MSPRHTTLYVLLLALLSILVLRVEAQHGSTNQPAREAIRLAKEEAAKDNPEEPEFTGTIFNEQEVPPMIELGKNMEELLADGYWFVEAFSPYCGHCKSLAPKLQTIYEFYYTSDPLPASSEPKDLKTSLNSFSRYYNIKFAKLDCVAFGTACADYKVQSYPTMFLFKDGEQVKTTTGDRTMEKLSAFIEECLEIIRPGSRPVGGLPELPTSGVSSFSTKLASSASDPTVTDPEIATINRPTNPDGISVPMDPEVYETLVTKSLDPWFIKFYAPWCPHCQRMAPSWKGMAREMQGKLNIGEVNCDVEKKLCRQAGVDRFPMLKLIKGPDAIVYNGLRGVGDLIDYAKKSAEAIGDVQEVNLAEFEMIEETEDVIFVYFHDQATTTEDFTALERLPIHLLDHAKLVKTSDAAMVKRFKVTTWPRLLVSRKSRYTVFDHLMPQDIRDVEKVTKWMQSVWLPLVPELTAANAQQLMQNKYAVLAILDRGRKEAFAMAQKELETAATEWLEKAQHAYELERQELRDAKTLRIEEAQDRDDKRAEENAKRIKVDMNNVPRKEVVFAWVDGVFWEHWLKTQFGLNVKDGEVVVINDEDNQRYWDRTVTGNSITPSRTSILETLGRVATSSSKLPSKNSGPLLQVYFHRARNAVTRHPLISLPALAASILALIIIWFRGRRRRREYSTGGMYDLVSGNGVATSNNGLLGGNKGD